MKNYIKISLLFFIAVSASPLSSCSSAIKVGVLQFCTHDALNLCFEGLKKGMEEEGYEDGGKIDIIFQNPEGESSTENSMATNLALNSSLVIGIATPSALALKTAVEDSGKDVPEVFCSVTDPVQAGLVASFTQHGNIVGTSDAGPTEENLALFNQFSVSKIGMLYNIAEENSIVQYNEAREASKKLGLELVDGGVSSSADIESELRGMIANGIKGVFIPVDNTVAAAMASIKPIIEENKILAVCGDASEIKNGGSLGYATDYYSLGITTGKMAGQILSGVKAETISCAKSEVYNLYINDAYFKTVSSSLPTSLKALGNGTIIHE